MGEPASGGFEVTERDVEIVRWIGRQRFVVAGQVARRFRMDQRNAYRRLRGLVGLGLLDHRRVFHGQPGAYWATRAGLRTVGLRLPVAGVDIRTYRHDLIATDVVAELEIEFGERALLTEREIRSRDSSSVEKPRYAIRLGGQAASGRRGLHYPDLAVAGSDGRLLVVEVELTAKGRRRLDSIVAGYVRARHIAGVRYYVSAAARPGLERSIGRAHAGELFDLRLIEGSGR